MVEEHFYCDRNDGKRIEFKSANACKRYFKSHKDEIKPYGCGMWRIDQVRHFILTESILADLNMSPEMRRRMVEDLRPGCFNYW